MENGRNEGRKMIEGREEKNLRKASFAMAATEIASSPDEERRREQEKKEKKEGRKKGRK